MGKTGPIEFLRALRGSFRLQAILLLLPLLWIGVYVVATNERESAFQKARAHGDSIAKVFQENTERIFERVDQSLLVLRAMYAKDPEGFRLKSWSDVARLATSDVVQFAMIGRDGFMFDTTTGYAGPPLYLGDREHVVGARALSKDTLFVGRPVVGRASGRWTIQLSRKLTPDDPDAGSVIVGSIDTSVVGKFYDTANLGSGGSLVLRNADNVILSAKGINQDEILGKQIPPPTEAAEDAIADGQFWSRGRLDRVDRLVTLRRSSSYPLIFTVGIAEADIKAQYEYRQRGYVIAGLFLTVMILAAVGIVYRKRQAIERSQRELHNSVARFEDTLRYMPLGLSMFDGDGCLVAYNQQWLDIYGFPPEAVRIGMSVRDIFVGLRGETAIDDYISHFQNQLAETGHASNTVTLPNGKVVSVSFGRRQSGGWVATHEDITARRAAEERIEKLAHFDNLTGLANRNLFKERIEEALARSRRFGGGFAVLLLDLDKFKAVNDVLGHQAGDVLLSEVAKRIRSEIREVDTPARIGGDEFALVVMPGRQFSLADGAAILAGRMIQAISAPYQIDGHPVLIGCSIGIALVPDHGERIDEILRNADLALYKSKNSGRNRFNLYSPELKEEADRRDVLEVELREAIWREEIEIFYQPIVDLESGRISTVEALARWNHSEHGYIPPAEFVPVAEEAGLIGELGNLILAKACADASRMPGDVRVAVNLSAMHFAKGDVVNSVAFALVDSGLAEHRLELEITESVILADTSDNLRTLERLRRLGVSIALDDFGVGYSSLSYLTAFSFDKVKIDRSFIDKIDRPETVAVLSSIVQLARTLNLAVVAEGIETVEQLEAVRALGVPLGQGYLFGRPACVAELDIEPRRLTVEDAAA